MDIILSKGIEFTKTGLSFNKNATFDEWVEAGKKLSTVNKYVQFWIGDWILHGERSYGEMYAQALDQTLYSYTTLTHAKWVASRIPPERRRPNLSWSHHHEIADLEPEDQDELLDEAEKQKLSVSKFRKLVFQKKIRLDLPEMSDKELSDAQKPSKDFDRVQTVIDKGLSFLEALQVITVSRLEARARGYLFSHLRDVVREVGKEFVYEEQKAVSDALDNDTQAKKKNADS